MNNIIEVTSIDGKIWEPGVVAIKLFQKLQQYDQVIIDLLSEAPDIANTDLMPILQTLRDQGITKNRIRIQTGNLLESLELFEIEKCPDFMFELIHFQRLAHTLPKNKKIQKHFGCLINRSNIVRLIMASHLWVNYSDKTLQTYHYQSQADYHRVHLGLENLMYYFGTNSVEYQEALKLLANGPLLIDKIQQYPIEYPDNIFNPCSWYENFFVDIVCETFSIGQTFFLTEKFWRPIVTKTPFIIQGPQFILQRLRQLGFKTFSRWWSEGYDNDPYLYSQNEIKKILKQLSTKSVDELNDMYKSMQDVLDHNYERFIELKFDDFKCVTIE